jgi:hypothetical protein
MFWALFGHPGGRLSQPARRPDGRVRRHQGAKRLPDLKRPTVLQRAQRTCPERRVAAEQVSFKKVIPVSGERASSEVQDRHPLSEARAVPPLIRHDTQCQYGHALNLIFLDLAYCLRRAEVRPLADYFLKQTPAISRRSQDELLCPRGFFFSKDKRSKR